MRKLVKGENLFCKTKLISQKKLSSNIRLGDKLLLSSNLSPLPPPRQTVPNCNNSFPDSNLQVMTQRYVLFGIVFMSAFKWGNQPKRSVLLKFTTGGPWISPDLREVKSQQKHVTKLTDILRHKILQPNSH